METDRQTDRETERLRQTDRQRNRETDRQRERENQRVGGKMLNFIIYKLVQKLTKLVDFVAIEYALLVMRQNLSIMKR